MGKKKVSINEDKPSKEEEKSVVTAKDPMVNTPTFRIVTASYEHNLLCLSLSLYKGKTGVSEIFTPIFHFTAHTQSIRCLARNRRYLVSGSNDEHIRIYDLQKRKELGFLLHHSGSISALKFYHDKWMLSGAGDGKICIWRVKDWETLGEMKGHTGEVNDISIHPTGRLALSVSQDKTLRLWNLMTAKKASILKLRNQALKVCWSPQGDYFIVGYDRSISIYSAQDSQVVHEFKLASPLQHLNVLTIKNKDYLATSHSDGKVVITHLDPLLESKESDDSFELQAHASRVKYFDTLHDDETDIDYMTTVSSDGKMVIHDLIKRDQIAVYETGDRLNCCLMVPEKIEKPDTMKKRKESEISEADDTDFSASESEAEQQKSKKSKKNKAKKTKVTIEME